MMEMIAGAAIALVAVALGYFLCLLQFWLAGKA